ncbi:MAG TPA: two-component regulator propeller domain-containing protein [Flavobacteriales bacterium]|jgi:signal transduction histidine kinase/ligand-binding sensor domain-containing protein|nr:two-component regulator propeller domain-containing protein [Flavobacteriales bacterium]
MNNASRRSLRITRAIALCLAALTTQVQVLAQGAPFRAYTVADGVPSNTVYSVLQDRDGFLWFGTDAGVARFDGLHFRTYTTTDGLSDNEVLSMFQDHAGRIWFLTLNGRLSFFFDGRFHSAVEHPELAQIRPASGLYAMAEDGDGRLWFGGVDGGLYTWQNGKVEERTIADRPILGLVRPIRAADGRVFVISSFNIHVAEHGRLRFLRTWGADRRGFPWVCANGPPWMASGALGLLQLDEQRDSVLVPWSALPYTGELHTPLAGRDGSLWVPTSSGGVLHVPRKNDRYGTAERWYREMNVNSVFEDREGDIWLATDGYGAMCVNAQQQRVGLVRAGMDQRLRAVTAVLSTPAHGVLFGTAGGSIHQWHEDRIDLLSQPYSGAEARDRVRTLKQAPNGAVFLATDRWNGIIRWDGGGPHVVPVPCYDARLLEPVIMRYQGLKAIAIGPRGETVGTFYGVAHLIDTLGGPMYRFNADILPELQRVYAPYIDAQGGIWFETNERLHRYADGQDQEFPDLDRAFGSRITCITGLDDSTLVIATAGNGVQLVRNGRILRSFTVRDGLCSDQCRVAVVRQGRILVATNAGANSIDDPLGEARIQQWGIATGLPSNDIQDIDLHGTRVLLATPEGLCTVPLERGEVTPLPPILALGQVLVNDSVRATTDHVQLALGERLTLQVQALSFAAPELVELQLWMEGDTERVSMDRSVKLNALPAGTHRVVFRARALGSAWSHPLDVWVDVAPPWHATAWFRALLVLMVSTLGLWAAAHLSRRQLRKRVAEMDQRMAMQEERQRIAADLHDDLGADISHLLMLTRQSAGSASLPAADRSNLGSIEAYANSLLQKIDEIIWSMDPRDDELVPALSFIQRYAETFAEAHGMTFRTQPLVHAGNTVLPSLARRELYLVVKELLHNIAKHTDARTLRFQAGWDKGMLFLVLEDDGSPVHSLPAGRFGHGKANMRLRLERLNGSLRSTPIDGVGTRSTITLPLNNDPQN